MFSTGISEKVPVLTTKPPILRAAAPQHDGLCLPRSEDRADVPEPERSLSGGAYLADDWRAGGVSKFKVQAEPAFRHAAVGGKLPGPSRIAIRSHLKVSNRIS